MTKTDEHDVRLSEYDMDHLRGGQPVFKPVGDDLIVLRPPLPDAEEDDD